MRRTVHPTPRHLDAPLRIVGFTLPQWGVLGVACLVLWGCLALLSGFIPPIIRGSIGAALIGGPVGLVFSEDASRSILEVPRRVWHSLKTPGQYVTREPILGPLWMHLYDTATVKDDPEDA